MMSEVVLKAAYDLDIDQEDNAYRSTSTASLSVAFNLKILAFPSSLSRARTTVDWSVPRAGSVLRCLSITSCSEWFISLLGVAQTTDGHTHAL
jgi:hypothetical protein